MQKYLFIALSLGFLLMAFVAFEQAKPTTKAPIYKIVKEYSPYYIDKRFGGLQIMSKNDEEFKEKPVNAEVFHRLEYLEKSWGGTHLKLIGNQLTILDNDGKTLKTITITSQEDSNFIHHFYGI